jgi:hypothetical protein
MSKLRNRNTKTTIDNGPVPVKLLSLEPYANILTGALQEYNRYMRCLSRREEVDVEM